MLIVRLASGAIADPLILTDQVPAAGSTAAGLPMTGPLSVGPL